jgi:hypothetical protein
LDARLPEVVSFLCGELASITEQPITSFNDNSALIGSTAVVASLGFVRLLLAAEDYAAEHLGFAFDWTSDGAMSEARSHFRTVGTLAQYLLTLSGSQFKD